MKQQQVVIKQRQDEGSPVSAAVHQKENVLVNRVNDYWELMNLVQSDIGKSRNPYSYEPQFDVNSHALLE